MRIAVASQNFRTVTPHAGRTRRFLLFDVGNDGAVTAAGELDLPKELAFHEWHEDGPHPLDDVNVILAGSCGDGFVRRMTARGIEAVATDRNDPLQAIQDYLAGTATPEAKEP